MIRILTESSFRLYTMIGNDLIGALMKGSIVPVAVIVETRLVDGRYGRAIAVWSDYPATPYDSFADMVKDVAPPSVSPWILAAAILACPSSNLAKPSDAELADLVNRHNPSPDDRQIEMWPESNP